MAKEYDTLIEWALASAITGERAGEMGIATPDEGCEDHEEAGRQPLLGKEAIRQARLSRREEGEYGLASTVGTEGAAYLEGEGRGRVETLVLARAAAELSGTNPGGVLDKILDPSLAKALVEELEGVARYADGDLVDSVETSWADPALQKGPGQQQAQHPLC